MNLSEETIETVLRRAPRPTPPAGLRAALLAQVRLADVRPATETEAQLDAAPGWFRRWWPVLLPATVSLACGVVLWVQQLEINQLKESIRALSPSTNSVEVVPAGNSAETPNDSTQTDDPAAKEQSEIARLKQLAAQFTAELDQLQEMQTENESPRARISAASGLSPEELNALAKAKERGQTIQCCNNLKQFGLAVRLWASDYSEMNPPDSLSMSNELTTPKVLVCPADTNRVAARTWAEYTSANCSYEYLAPGAIKADELEPTRVLARCPIHGHLCLCDGSVQMGVAKTHPD